MFLLFCCFSRDPDGRSLEGGDGGRCDAEFLGFGSHATFPRAEGLAQSVHGVVETYFVAGVALDFIQESARLFERGKCRVHRRESAAGRLVCLGLRLGGGGGDSR